MEDDLVGESNPHDQVLASMRELATIMKQSGLRLRMPPRSLEQLGTRFVDIQAGKMLAAEIPFHEEFCNPTGVMQGGFLCAAFDEVFGPLSYMAARRPAVTIEMNTSFIRPFQAKHRLLIVRANLVSASRTLLLMEATATSPDGKLIAVAKVHCAVLTDAQSSRFVEAAN